MRSKLKAVRDKLKLKLDCFGDRLKFQKTIYLLKHLGLDLGYRFSYYISGPYAPSLARDAFAIDSATEASSLSTREIKCLERFEKLTGGKDTLWYEFVASVVFLKKAGFSKEDIRKKLEDEKAYLFTIHGDRFEEVWTVTKSFD